MKIRLITISTVILVTLRFFALCGFSQEATFSKPDYDVIQQNITDSSSRYYYPELMKRMVAFDTSLTTEEYRHLYYGYVLQDDYMPYRVQDDEKLQKYYQWPADKKFRVGQVTELMQLTTKAIETNPFDLRPMNMLCYAYHLQGNEEMALKVSFRFNGILGAIMSTGDGRTCNTGFHVITIAHEYVILNVLGFQPTGQALVDKCDVMSLMRDERGVNELYFDVSCFFGKF